MESDKPISQLIDDRLRRVTFIRAMAIEISGIKDKECSVVGLYGKWGSGKTSIIKLLDEELKKSYFFTAYFNPWRYKSEDILLKELFQNILEGVRSDKGLTTGIEELGKLFDDYSQYVSLPKISVLGFELDLTNPVKGLGKGIGTALKSDDTFDLKKKRINEILKSTALPLIIFIDDVDRLDITEIQSLFKIIKLTADFNNLIYVIAFDDEIVAKALASNYGTGDIVEGKCFLEKIVQLPLRIPFINNQERFEFTISLLNDWLSKYKIQLTDKYQDEFISHFKSLHDRFIKTPRDSKRLLNSVSFSYQCLKDEVCLFDIILLETIRIFIPLVFNELISFKYHLFSNPSSQNGITIRPREEEIGKLFKEKISIYQDALVTIQGCIDFLFPSNNIFNIGWDTYRDETQEDLFKYQRVGIQRYFDRFIEFKIDENDISDTEFKMILEVLNNKDYSEIQGELKRLVEFPKETILTLFIHFKSQFSDLGKINVAKIVCITPHFFVDKSISGKMFHRPTRLALELLEKVEISSRVSALRFISEHCETINYAAFIIFECLRGYGTKQEFKFEPINDLESITKDFVANIQNLPIQSLFINVDEEKNDILFNLIERYGDLNSLKEELLSYIEGDFSNGLLVMKSLIPMTYYNFSTVGVYGHEISHSRFEAIEFFVPRDVLKKVCFSLFPELQDLRNLKPIDHFEPKELNNDKDILNQYMLYVVTNERMDVDT